MRLEVISGGYSNGHYTHFYPYLSTSYEESMMTTFSGLLKEISSLNYTIIHRNSGTTKNGSKLEMQRMGRGQWIDLVVLGLDFLSLYKILCYRRSTYMYYIILGALFDSE